MKKEQIKNIWKDVKKKTLLILLSILIGIMFFQFVNAATTFGTYKQWECVELKQNCGNCSYVNISNVIYPNSSQALGQVVMTKIGQLYNYTFCSTSATGNYIVSGFGNDDGVVTIFSYDFKITPSGYESISLWENSMLLIFLIFGIIVLVMGISLENVWFGFISSVIFLLGGIYTMIYGYNNLQNFYTQGFAYVLIGLAIIIMFASAYEWISWGSWKKDDDED